VNLAPFGRLSRRRRRRTLRQYDLVSRAAELGWPPPAVRVIDADLGVSGSGLAARAGFTELTEQIALGQVGIVLALEVSRLARSSAEWYRLLGAPRGAVYSCGDGSAPPPGRRSGLVKLEAA
jgi:DNA invertase Pin-like site-specific DNA recombinase